MSVRAPCDGDGDAVDDVGTRLDVALRLGLAVKRPNETTIDSPWDDGTCPATSRGSGSPVVQFLGPKTGMILNPTNKNVVLGMKTLAQIQCDGVIDAFMAANPEFRKILWGRGGLSMAEAKGMISDLLARSTKDVPVINSLAEIPELKGYQQTGKRRTGVTVWTGPSGNLRYVKVDGSWRGPESPNDGRFRILMNMVGLKLMKFNPSYGWDVKQSAYYMPDKRDPTNRDKGDYPIVMEPYWPSRGAMAKPRFWLYPQMHYLGVLHIDNHGGNYGQVDADVTMPVPVDLDAFYRDKGNARERYTLMRMNTDATNAKFVSESYL